MAKVKNWFNSGFDIDLDEYYYIAFHEQKEIIEQSKKDKRYERYWQIKSWPDSPMRDRELAKLPPEENPFYIKITGRMLIEWAERGFVPQFDVNFRQTRRLVMLPIDGYKFFIDRKLER